jgi:hypothetical protein
MHNSAKHTTRSTVLLAIVASAALLSACNKAGDDRTAGQKLDSAIAKTEQKTAEAGATAREATRDAGQAISNAGDAVANKARDVAITASVNGRLASDERLSALKINVDTADGRVVLRGTAPDEAARAHATELARSVEGVRTVDNELTLQSGAK